MLVQLGLDGTPRTLKSLSQVDLDGMTMRDLKQLWQNDAAGVPRLVFTALSVNATPRFLTGIHSGRGGSGSSYIGSVTATVVGGSAPFIYAWTATGGFSVVSPTSATTGIIAPSVGPGDEADGTASVTVTDANGTSAVSPIVELQFLNYGGGLA